MGSAWTPQTSSLVNGNVLNDGTADSPRGWAISTNADYTFTATGTSRAKVTATSANRSVNLPTTSIKAGINIEVETACSGGYTIAIKSSDGDTIDTLIGDKGRIRLMALQDAPTDGTHWEVVDVVDSIVITPTFTFTGGATAASSVLLVRNMLSVSCDAQVNEVTSATASGSCVSSAGAIPAKFRPSYVYGSEHNALTTARDNGTIADVPGMFVVQSAGTMVVQKNILSTGFTGGAGGATGHPRKVSLSWRIA